MAPENILVGKPGKQVQAERGELYRRPWILSDWWELVGCGECSLMYILKQLHTDIHVECTGWHFVWVLLLMLLARIG